MELVQKEDAERKRLEEAEEAHLAEIQSLQVRVRASLKGELRAPQLKTTPAQTDQTHANEDNADVGLDGGALQLENTCKETHRREMKEASHSSRV